MNMRDMNTRVSMLLDADAMSSEPYRCALEGLQRFDKSAYECCTSPNFRSGSVTQ